MAATLKKAFKSFNKTSKEQDPKQNHPDGVANAPEGKLFPKTDPLIDGEDCLHDCETCTIRLPSGFKIDEKEELYGHVNAWSTHLIVGTGKTDWVRDVADEKGSVMEAVGKAGQELENGKLMLSASNLPLPSPPSSSSSSSSPTETPTTVLLLPAFTLIDNVTPSSVSTLLTHHIALAPTNTTPLHRSPALPLPPAPLTTRPCPHRYLILLCSQKTRDARCGQSAPLLRRELERHLRPLGLQRDVHDARPGGVGIYFISHVGGHKFSANMMVYRRAGAAGVVAEERDGDTAAAAAGGKGGGEGEQGAAQCIWLARVRPEDCENIVRYTVLQGRVVKPERQLRGGFDRGTGLVSW